MSLETQPTIDRFAADARFRCPVCKTTAAHDFFDLPRLPVHVGVLHGSPEEAQQAATGRVTLAYCPACRFAFNRSFEPEKLVFTPGYEVQLVHSAMFRAFLEELADRLIERYALRGKNVVDIGCGAGHFLRLLCERGGNRGLGIDPTLAREGEVPLSSGSMRLVRAVFDGSHDLQCDFAACQSVLEDIPDPVRFMADIRRLVEPRGGHVYLEVFNAFRAFEAGEVWSICYEQCNYYSLASFRETAARAGLRMIEAGTCYGEDQYIFVEATPASEYFAPADPNLQPPASSLQPPLSIRRFSELHAERIETWRERVARFRQSGQRVVVWGSGGKGICFLNTVGATDVFQVVVDINPDRQNQYVPGTGQKVVAPEWLRGHPPDAVVLTNPLYEGEIRQTLAQLGLEPDLYTI